MLEVNFSPFPTITTDRLLLRQMTVDDVNEVFFLRSDEGVMRYVRRARASTTDDILTFIQKIDAGIANGELVLWVIAIKDAPKYVVGNICIWKIQRERYQAEVGYTLHTDWHGKGIMHEALKAVLEYGFNSIKLHSIEAIVNPENQPSINLLARNGFVREAFLKENFYFDGVFHNSAIYSLLSPVK